MHENRTTMGVTIGQRTIFNNGQIEIDAQTKIINAITVFRKSPLF